MTSFSVPPMPIPLLAAILRRKKSTAPMSRLRAHDLPSTAEAEVLLPRRRLLRAILERIRPAKQAS